MAFVFYLQSLMIILASTADIASDVDIGEKIHLDALQSVALASLAASAFDVKTEAAGFIAAFTGLRQHRDQVADWREHLGIGRGVRTGCPADRGLIDLDHLIDQIESGD